MLFASSLSPFRKSRRCVMENFTAELPVNGKRKLILKGLTGITSVVGAAYGYYLFNYATSLSGTYKVAAPPPKMINKLDQVDLCRNYIRFFEKCNNGKYICGSDCRQQLQKLCGINADDILKNMDAKFL